MKLGRESKVVTLVAVALMLALTATARGARGGGGGGGGGQGRSEGADGPVSGEAALKAENKMLRATVARQKAQIAALRERVGALLARLKEAGISEKGDPGAADRPADAAAGTDTARPDAAPRRADE